MAGWFPVRVAGDSMLPTLRAGDLCAVRPVRAGEPRPGQIVVARARGVEVVKRVAAPPDGQGVWLLGDNPPASTDSRQLGPYAPADIVGVVRGRYWPPWRIRRFGV